jgi:hypothetical protein
MRNGMSTDALTSMPSPKLSRAPGSQSGFWTVSDAHPLEKQTFCFATNSFDRVAPELYLRRPPAKNEQYRLDRMLQAAAQRGVRVNVIVYKEVTQALTRMYQLTDQDRQGISVPSALY